MAEEAVRQKYKLATTGKIQGPATGPGLHDPPGDNPGHQTGEPMKKIVGRHAMGFKQFKKGACDRA